MINKQTNKQTNKQKANKQNYTNKQTKIPNLFQKNKKKTTNEKQIKDK